MEDVYYPDNELKELINPINFNLQNMTGFKNKKYNNI